MKATPTIEPTSKYREGRPPLRGGRNQCPSCGLLFHSISGFDKHRVGRMGVDRRCMTATEMLAAGMAQRPDDFWVSERMSQAAADRCAAAVEVLP